MPLGVKVNRKCGEQFRKALVEMEAFDSSRKIASDEYHIYLPVFRLGEEEASRLRQVADFEMVEREFLPEERHLCPEDLLGFRPSFEVVGDIAIVEPERAEEIASAVMSCYKGVKVAVTPVSDVEGEFRTRRFRHVAGEKRTLTTHKEHGLRYRLDLGSTYFTPRLGTERLRIAGLVHPGEFVLDMFAGVGPFALLLSKRGARVVAIDKNPAAVKYMRENALLNKIQEIEILEGDASEIAQRYENNADHVIMNLPHMASHFLIPAIKAAKNGGVVHYYTISPEENLYKDADLIKKCAEDMGADVDILYQGIVRSYAPRRYNVVIDFRVIKTA